MIKVVKNRVFDGNSTYEVGDVIKNLSREEEEKLVSEGIAEYEGEVFASVDESEHHDGTSTDDSASEVDGEEPKSNIFNVQPEELVETPKPNKRGSK